MTERARWREHRDRLIPVLLLRIGKLTERLVGAGEAFESDTEEARRVGWLLGFLSNLAGEELLGSRREPDELELALELVGQWVVSRDASWALVGAPALRLDAADWRACATCAAFVMDQVLAAEELQRARVEFVEGPAGVELELRLERSGGELTREALPVPPGWLQ